MRRDIQRSCLTMTCLRSLMTKCVAAATGKCRRLPLVPGGKGQQPAYSYDEGFAKGLILNLFMHGRYLPPRD